MHTEGAHAATGAAPRPARHMIFDLDKHAAPFVSVAELAAYWGVSEQTIRRDIEKGAIADVRRVGTGNQIRIPIKSAREYGKPHGSH